MMNSFLLVAAVILLLAVNCYSSNDPVDGGWTGWAKFHKGCNATCGGGYLKKYRLCSNPVPVNNGLDCPGDNTTMEECNTHACQNGKFGPWSNCDVFCNINGLSVREKLCGNETVSIKCLNPEYEQKTCSTWNPLTCPDPCENVTCPERAICKNLSTALMPIAECHCLMGLSMNDEETACIRPPPEPPTPRPIPTIAPELEVVVVAMTRTASTILITCVSICLFIFMLFRIYTEDRIIQMNMEVSLLIAHCLLLFPSDTYENEIMCRTISILLHFFFTACFMFMFLESIHMYSMVAYVVKKGGMLTAGKNMFLGWGIPAFIVIVTMTFHYDEYYGEYHCWLRMDNPIMLGQVIPNTVLLILTLIMIEAAGAAEYPPLPDMNRPQLLSARISQRSNLLILLLVYVSWLLGVLAEYEQDIYLYSTFTVVNGILGVSILVLHVMGNEKIRQGIVTLCTRSNQPKKKKKKQQECAM